MTACSTKRSLRQRSNRVFISVQYTDYVRRCRPTRLACETGTGHAERTMAESVVVSFIVWVASYEYDYLQPTSLHT